MKIRYYLYVCFFSLMGSFKDTQAMWTLPLLRAFNHMSEAADSAIRTISAPGHALQGHLDNLAAPSILLANQAAEARIGQLNELSQHRVAELDKALESRIYQAALTGVVATAAVKGAFLALDNMDYGKKPEQSSRKFWSGSLLAILGTAALYKKYSDIEDKRAQREPRLVEPTPAAAQSSASPATLSSAAALSGCVGVYLAANNMDYDKQSEQSAKKFWFGSALVVFNTLYLGNKYYNLQQRKAQRDAHLESPAHNLQANVHGDPTIHSSPTRPLVTISHTSTSVSTATTTSTVSTFRPSSSVTTHSPSSSSTSPSTSSSSSSSSVSPWTSRTSVALSTTTSHLSTTSIAALSTSATDVSTSTATASTTITPSVTAGPNPFTTAVLNTMTHTTTSSARTSHRSLSPRSSSSSSSTMAPTSTTSSTSTTSTPLSITTTATVTTSAVSPLSTSGDLPFYFDTCGL